MHQFIKLKKERKESRLRAENSDIAFFQNSFPSDSASTNLTLVHDFSLTKSYLLLFFLAVPSLDVHLSLTGKRQEPTDNHQERTDDLLNNT